MDVDTMHTTDNSDSHSSNVARVARHMMKHLLSNDDGDIDGFDCGDVTMANVLPITESDLVDAITAADVKHMSNSERGKYYRLKRKIYNTQLQQRVTKLRLQVEALMISRQVQQELAIGMRHTHGGSLARLAQHYYSQFEHGTPVNLSLLEGTNCTTATVTRVASATPTQALFLYATMIEDVRFGNFRGIPAILEQWQLYSSYHAGLHFAIKSVDSIQHTNDFSESDWLRESMVVTTQAELRVRFSRKTIEHIFPHVLGDEVLTQELIGMEVTYPIVNRFYFNNDGKVEQYDPEVDFVSALMEKLQNIDKVAQVLGQAMLATDGGMIDEGAVGNSSHGSPISRGDRRESRFAELDAEIEETNRTRGEDSVGSNSNPFGSRMELDFILS